MKQQTQTRKRKRGGSNLPVVIGLVIGIHLLMGGALYALTQTDAGQEFVRIHKIKFLEPEQEKQEEVKNEPPPPPPQIEQKLEAPPPTAAPAPTTSAPAVAVGGGGINWAGGKFIGGGLEDGPMGAFHAGVLGRMRSCFGDWPGPAAPAEVALDVSKSGAVVSYNVVRGTGVSSEDEHLLDAIKCVQKKGVAAPPDGVGRVVTLRLRPTRGLVSGQG
ncbi:MAG TPA: hypothetical protein VMR31_05355 [Myxococcota bacterium]|nr:hypothetical protein [Myxococcota bacterium]